MNDIDSDWIRM